MEFPIDKWGWFLVSVAEMPTQRNQSLAQQIGQSLEISDLFEAPENGHFHGFLTSNFFHLLFFIIFHTTVETLLSIGS